MGAIESFQSVRPGNEKAGTGSLSATAEASYVPGPAPLPVAGAGQAWLPACLHLVKHAVLLLLLGDLRGAQHQLPARMGQVKQLIFGVSYETIRSCASR
jgi:hypothetical protein